jgi:hypothetical protein
MSLRLTFADVDLYGSIIQLAFAQLLAKFLAGAALRLVVGRSCRCAFEHHAAGGSLGGTRSRGRKQNIQQALFSVEFGLVRDVFELFFAHHFDRDLHQVADHGLNIASYIADFGELRRFYFEEW